MRQEHWSPADTSAFTIETADGKLTAEQIAAYTDAHYADASFETQMVQPKMVYISNPTEIGTIYKKRSWRRSMMSAKREGFICFRRLQDWATVLHAGKMI